MFRSRDKMKWLLKGSLSVAVISIMLYACANPGTPTGGPRDFTPPRVLGSTPKAYAINNTKAKIIISFDEYVKLDKPSEKIVVSPPQLQQPEIKTSGKKIIVNLLDSLLPKSTYTIDFSDAIQDNNEGNPLGDYAFTFSTGEAIDTMQVSGTILNAADLEPIKGIMVGLHADLSDSAFLKKPFDRVGRTDSKGHFSIRGVARGKYRIYALMDGDQNFIFSQKSEAIAFDDSLVVPTCAAAIRQDTTWIDSLTIDTIKQINYTRYMPDNIVMRAFKETKMQQSLAKKERLIPQMFSLYFTAPNKKLPDIRGLNFKEKDAFVIQTDNKLDTIHYWIKDSVNYKKDTLSLALSYFYTDSLNRLLPRTDTLNLVSKQKTLTKEVEAKKKKKKNEPVEVQPLPMDKHVPQSMDVYDNITFTFQEPLRSYDSKAIRLKQKVDSLYKEVKFELQQDTTNAFQYNLIYNWEPEKEYSLEVDSAAFRGMYGLVSGKIKENFKVHSLNDYGEIHFNVSGADSKAFVELLDGSSDKVLRKMPVRDGRANFYFLAAGKYCARLVNDINGNGVWDTGDYATKRQPEEVFYFPEIINLKVLWNIDKSWNVRSIPLERQKPSELKKQKADDNKNKNRRGNRNNNNNNNRRSGLTM